MVVMLGLQKFDIEKMGYTRHAECLFVVVQIICACVVGFMYTKIEAMPDDGVKIAIPAVTQFGQQISPASEKTAQEYDREKWAEQLKQSLIGRVVLGGIYYKWGYLMPLVLQILMTPMQLYESPLFRIHILTRTVARPFPAPN